MSYDPYNDPYNPVRKGGRPDLGNGNGGGDFEYGSGGRDIPVNPASDGVTCGYTDAQEWVEAWRSSGPDGGDYQSKPDVDGD